MSIDWSKVTETDVRRACSQYNAGGVQSKRAARNTFLLVDENRYPAKFIRGLAYEIATGDKLSSDEYSGGMETVNFFRSLGFSVEYKNEVLKGNGNRLVVRDSARHENNAVKDEDASKPKMQKAFLQRLLEKRFGCVETEARFSWLRVPEYTSLNGVLREIYDDLVKIRGHKDFSTPGYPLACDFYIPAKNMIIEYDERQHFTEERARSLLHYPSDLNLGFRIDEWCTECKRIRATDSDPIYRDEQRAFYDSLRDISAAQREMSLIRIKHGDYDWGAESSEEVLEKLLNHSEVSPAGSDLEELIEETIQGLACDFSHLQEIYHNWTRQFHTHEEVIRWLKEHKIIASDRVISKQDDFNLASSHWNTITLPILYMLAPDQISMMKDRFNELFKNRSREEIRLAWYLLYFIHPVRHELYYFNLHYPDGYHFRLARLIRSHRLGLKAARTYLSKEASRSIDDSFITGCRTVAFKHLHLHPTTSFQGKQDLQDLKDRICNLKIDEAGKTYLTGEEMNIAMALSESSWVSFEKWIEYAPCAINEGPIFRLKKDKSHSDCFNEMVKILQRPDHAQKDIRAVLGAYYEIKPIRKSA